MLDITHDIYDELLNEIKQKATHVCYMNYMKEHTLNYIMIEIERIVLQ